MYLKQKHFQLICRRRQNHKAASQHFIYLYWAWQSVPPLPSTPHFLFLPLSVKSKCQRGKPMGGGTKKTVRGFWQGWRMRKMLGEQTNQATTLRGVWGQVRGILCRFYLQQPRVKKFTQTNWILYTFIFYTLVFQRKHKGTCLPNAANAATIFLSTFWETHTGEVDDTTMS